jgi:mRNA interferase MazF
MNKWDIVLVSYPFTDGLTMKVRPAIVISPNLFHKSGPDALFMFITSNTDRQASHDVFISTTHQEFLKTGLRKESAIRVSKIMTLSKSLVKKTIGSIGVQLSLNIESKLRMFLELPPYQPPLPG